MRYFIAAYQRGYRWNPLQVVQLLEDVREFTKRRNPQPDQFYCLQPIVVKAGEDGSFEVVDGQQRLTTLLLILRYFNELLVEKRRLRLFTLAYETRPSLEDFLSDPTLEKGKSNIDFSHLFDAMQAIEKWFDARETEVEPVKAAFLNQTKVIWFQLAANDDPVAAFTRLNVGKIPLTNDELIRALFLRRPSEAQDSQNDLQLRIAHEWDLVEKTLQNDAFWYFISNEKSESENRIGFVFRLLAESDGMDKLEANDAYGVFYHFSRRLSSETADPELEWRRAKQKFMTLEEWFNDRNLFHIVGFLIHDGLSINEIARMAHDITKDRFERLLRERVYKTVFGPIPIPPTIGAIEESVGDALDSLQYHRHASKIRSVLLLFNIATLLENPRSNIRFQFDSFKEGSWDIEHVRSVSPDNLNTVALRTAWLNELLGYFSSQNSEPELCEDIREFLNLPNPKSRVDEFNRLYEELVSFFNESTQPEPDHRVSNLVLLDDGTNRSYKNAVFALKRQRLLSLDRAGIFVPLCTRNVFLKCYSERVEHVMFWQESDRESYAKAMASTISRFFVGDTETIQ